MIRHTKAIPVLAINVITKKMYYYESISAAARACNVDDKSIYNVLKGITKSKQTGLFTFKYADKLKPINNGNKKNKTD